MSEDSEQISLAPGEGAIVFSEDGIKLFAPTSIDEMPLEVQDTMEFVTFALLKTEWILEFYEHLATAEAIVDLMGKENNTPPKLTLIKGGLYEKTVSNKEETDES